MAYGPKPHVSQNCQEYDNSRTSQKQPIEKNNFGVQLSYTTYHHTAWDRMLPHSHISSTVWVYRWMFLLSQHQVLHERHFDAAPPMWCRYLPWCLKTPPGWHWYWLPPPRLCCCCFAQSDCTLVAQPISQRWKLCCQRHQQVGMRNPLFYV